MFDLRKFGTEENPPTPPFPIDEKGLLLDILPAPSRAQVEDCLDHKPDATLFLVRFDPVTIGDHDRQDDLQKFINRKFPLRTGYYVSFLPTWIHCRQLRITTGRIYLPTRVSSAIARHLSPFDRICARRAGVHLEEPTAQDWKEVGSWSTPSVEPVEAWEIQAEDPNQSIRVRRGHVAESMVLDNPWSFVRRPNPFLLTPLPRYPNNIWANHHPHTDKWQNLELSGHQMRYLHGMDSGGDPIPEKSMFLTQPPASEVRVYLTFQGREGSSLQPRIFSVDRPAGVRLKDLLVEIMSWTKDVGTIDFSVMAVQILFPKSVCPSPDELKAVGSRTFWKAPPGAKVSPEQLLQPERSMADERNVTGGLAGMQL